MTDHVTTAPRLLDHGDFGDLLLNRARGEHPTVSWWWGRRRIDDSDVAFCYVCDQAITEWNGYLRTWPLAAVVIDQHRITHLAEMRAEIIPKQETA